MAGARTHGVVEHDERERADRVARLAQRVHLGDLFVERTATELDAERVDGNPAALCRLVQSLRARILVALVAQHAVVDFAQDVARPHARIGQREAVAAAQPIGGADHPFRQVRPGPLDIDETPVVERFGKPEDYPRSIDAIVQPRTAPALEAVDLRGDMAAGPLGVHQRAAGARNGELQILAGGAARAARRGARDQRRDGGLVFRRRGQARTGFHEREHAPADEIHLEAKEIVLVACDGRQRVDGRLDAKEPRDEAADVRRHRNEKIRQRNRRTLRVGR